ncbi:MAG: amino acid ABC transporter ATP-binding protein [Erysipelotrichaceae bacterium]|nr:amino acid ABC transporter ATP-binding protein [Erysipelotrichaceae bacterium]
MIKAKHLYKTFESRNPSETSKNVKALKDVSIDINDGEIVCLVGPSGGGKSTLIRSLAGIEKCDKGEIFIDDEPLDLSNKNQRNKIGFVFQHFNLFPHLTVIENITLSPIKVFNEDKESANKKALELLKQVGLEDKANNYPNQLSGGQKQRVAIARSLALNPKYMLFDEPTSALDPEMVCEVLEVMQDLAKKGMGMIVVTHEMGFAKNLADRIVFLENGEIVEEDKPDKFFDNPDSERVKSFLAKINYLK